MVQHIKADRVLSASFYDVVVETLPFVRLHFWWVFFQRMLIYARPDIMEKQTMWWNEFGWETCVPATCYHCVHSAAMDLITRTATLKNLLGQEVDYFLMCGNNILTRLLLIFYHHWKDLVSGEENLLSEPISPHHLNI